MIWPLIAAGALALLASGIHGGVGDRIIRRIDPESLPGNPFHPISTMLLIRVSWHFVTITFLVLGIALAIAGFDPDLTAARGVTYLAGAAFAAWGVFALVVGFAHGGMRAFKTHPAPIIFVLMVFLIAWGAAEL